MIHKIVLVDDSPIDQEWFQLAAHAAGYEVQTFSDARGLTAFVRKTEPDVVLLDVNMPGLKGDIACQLLKDNPGTRDVKVVLYSVMAEKELARLAARCGADGYIIKSKDAMGVMNRLAEICE